MVKPMANPMVKGKPNGKQELILSGFMFQLAHIPLSFLPAFLAQVMKKPAAPLGRMAGLEKWDRKNVSNHWIWMWDTHQKIGRS